MKFLLDENLSKRIVPLLEKDFPGTTHVTSIGLERAKDKAIWSYVKKGKYVIVSRDSDFIDMVSLYGPPPQVILLSWGNCRRQEVAEMLIAKRDEILLALADPARGLVEIF